MQARFFETNSTYEEFSMMININLDKIHDLIDMKNCSCECLTAMFLVSADTNVRNVECSSHIVEV